MLIPHQRVLLVVDDREFASEEVQGLVGKRRFGDIIFKRRALIEHIRDTLPQWARDNMVHLRNLDDVAKLLTLLKTNNEDTSICVIAGCAGFPESARLTQLIERLPYAEEDFTDRLYRPLLVFLHNAHWLIEKWLSFQAAPLHRWEQSWQGSQRVKSVEPLDLAKIRDFLSFTCGSTPTRHFNEVQIDTYFYTKRSVDKQKMLAEYTFYGAVPESMRPWLIQPFDFRDEGERASYKMMRYYLADAALQWVHGAFQADTFAPFVDRIMFFLAARPQRACSKVQSGKVARELFVEKLEARAQQFLALDEGRCINQLAISASPSLGLACQLDRYRKLYQRYEKGFAFDHLVVGHGDPCFSNILYDQQHYLLKFIDPKGAVSPEDLWTHPLYDLCKVSHSALGDYDFINNGLYNVDFTDNNDLVLRFEHSNHAAIKPLFLNSVKNMGHDTRIMRLGEASLFLSMLPLHIDFPNKVIAFMVRARQILDEVENEQNI